MVPLPPQENPKRQFRVFSFQQMAESLLSMPFAGMKKPKRLQSVCGFLARNLPFGISAANPKPFPSLLTMLFPEINAPQVCGFLARYPSFESPQPIPTLFHRSPLYPPQSQTAPQSSVPFKQSQLVSYLRTSTKSL